MTEVGLILHYVQDQAGSGGSGSGHPDHTSWGVLVDRITSPNSMYILIQEVCECVPQRAKESQRPDFFFWSGQVSHDKGHCEGETGWSKGGLTTQRLGIKELKKLQEGGPRGLRKTPAADDVGPSIISSRGSGG